MKQSYWSAPCRAAVILFSFALVLQSSGAGSEKPKSTGTSTDRRSVSQKDAQGPGYVLEITDGRLAQDGGRPAELGTVVNVLRELYPEANIAVAPSILALKIRDLKLRATELPEALEAIRVAAEGRIMWRSGRGGALDPTTGLPVPAESSLYLIEPIEEPPPPGPARDIEVFNVSGYIRFLEQQQGGGAVDSSMDDVLRLIRSSCDELRRGAPEGEPPSFQFHRGANLLIVIGPRDLLDVARRVVNALPGQPPTGLGAYENRMPPGAPPPGAGTRVEPSQNAPLRLPQPGTPVPPGAPSPRR